jgi:hypothetical protein
MESEVLGGNAAPVPKRPLHLGISTGICVEGLHTVRMWSHPLFTVWQDLLFRRGGQQDADSVGFAEGPWSFWPLVGPEVNMGA